MDDAWYNAFIPTTQNIQPKPTHKRRVSLLQQPNEDLADVVPPEDAPRNHAASDSPLSPSKATVTRRTKSYSDIYNNTRSGVASNKSASRTDGNSKSRKRPRRRSEIESEGPFNFDDWYGTIQEELLDTSHERYRAYQDQLQSSGRHLDSLLDDTDTNLELLSTLYSSFQAVEAQASVFQSRCESLLAEQRRLAALADDVGQNLQYYSYLDPITRRLNAPGVGHFVRGDDFSRMLMQLDECLDYMQTHSKQREASTYGARYKLLLTRGLTLIRVHFTNTLRETAADVSRRIADRQLNDTTMPALLYAKFRVAAGNLKKLGLEIQKRAVPPPNSEPGTQGEYQSLVNELHQSYSAARGRLIIPLVRKKLAEIALAPSTSKDLVAFARTTVNYIRGICLDEFELWHQWFAGDDGLYDFLEAVSDPLYDHLRPRIIRETQLPVLCEMCTLLQVRYMDEHEDDSEPSDANQLEFSVIIRPALEDAQTRLVFLTLAVLRDDIERFRPKPNDLNYPARNRNVPLSGSKSKVPVLAGRKASTNGPETPPLRPPTVVEEDGADAVELKWRYESSASFRGWYPTLKKAIWLLSKIYRLVNSTVFDDLAHQIVHQTTLSLQNASTQLKSKASLVDSQLFLLQQLLILKQQIVAFDIEFVTPEVSIDFSSITNTFWELRERGGLFNPAKLVRLVGSSLMPNVVENMLDAKLELDGRLRTVINDFTNGFAARMTSAVAEPASKAKGFSPSDAVPSARAAIEKEVPLMRSKLDEYLEDLRTKETLAAAVQDQVQANYEDFFERHKTYARANGGSVSKKGKGREDDVWDPDIFADWAATVFGVGNALLEEDGSGSSPALSRRGST